MLVEGLDEEVEGLGGDGVQGAGDGEDLGHHLLQPLEVEQKVGVQRLERRVRRAQPRQLRRHVQQVRPRRVEARPQQLVVRGHGRRREDQLRPLRREDQEDVRRQRD